MPTLRHNLPMIREHYPAMVIGYLVGLAGWLLASHLRPQLWPEQPSEPMARPWREFGFAMIGVLGVIATGQLWTRGFRLPEDGPTGPLFEAFNQLFIFAPILLVVVIRRHAWTSAWLPRPQLGQRLLVGLLLATLAITTYATLREGAAAPWALVGRIWRYENFGKLVQVLLEDVAIAILFVRLAGALGGRWATFSVACLFAAGHVPALLAGGATWTEIAGLSRDALLGGFVLIVLQRSRDVVWFWCLHFCLDMTQFARINGVL